jgi:hypothetical protein
MNDVELVGGIVAFLGLLIGGRQQPVRGFVVGLVLGPFLAWASVVAAYVWSMEP